MKRLASVFKALSDESRLRIISLLIHSEELCVCDIQSIMGSTQTKISRHLGYLKRSGILSGRRQGLWMLYSIAHPADRDLRVVLDSLGKLLRENSVAQRDYRRLKSNLRQGCCATFSIVKPRGEMTPLQPPGER
jgi:ArsR family transcriptional regulator, arsenate/arsenite/antimonite-responsive transcriptional repressor